MLSAMDQTLNPYSPGAGLRPPALTGREVELQLIDTIIARVGRGLHNRGVILSGLRGVGKTVLLNEMSARAEQADWLIVQFEARADEAGKNRIRARLAKELALSARKVSLRSKWQHFKEALPVITSFALHVGGVDVALGAPAQKGISDSGDIGMDIEELVLGVAESAQKDGKAIAFFIDEMQDLDPELMSAIITAQHQAGQKGLPFYVFGAGLPTLPQKLAESHSYSERLFEYRRIGALDDMAAAAALEEPAAREGVGYTDAALTKLIGTALNYPYFLQEYGKAIWNLAPSSPFTENDAQLAIVEGTEALDSGFFPSRWERATPGEKRYLQAMAEVGADPVPTKEIADYLGVSVSSLSSNRKHLIEKGLIFAPDHGLVQFTVPGMADYIRRTEDPSS
ncbi:ATPase [Corynebacterium renale]|uniref:AAA ATPase-like protein n=2 Tax=Corynebacterium renale TaxID=1724 RepID=A0A2A9DPF8_9CORY|nr:AAA ATPase-like protein [Corynebacterium renale]SQI22082.1 ATPase [Corynebacterium renale]